MIGIEMFPDGERLWLLAADPRRPGGPTVHSLPVGCGELWAAAEMVLRAQLSAVAQGLVEGVCSGIASCLEPILSGGGGVLLAPRGPAHFLPLGAGMTAVGRPLAEEHALACVPSLSFVRSMLSRRARSHEEGVAIVMGRDFAGDGTVSGAVGALTGALESHGVAVRVFRGLRLVRRSAVSVVVAHGRGGELYGIGGNVARWRSPQAVAAELRDSALVFLAVCRSATGGVAPGAEPLGLVWPFLAAGCGAAVAGLWDVEPAATAAFAAELAAGFVGGRLSAGRAFGAAVARQRAEARFADMRDWAGWVLYGNPLARVRG